jgi:hypothetical protein|tara:strand:- start:20 stop:241 length:222 start_codon:yes stop_codon:yes gene_type:complete
MIVIGGRKFVNSAQFAIITAHRYGIGSCHKRDKKNGEIKSFHGCVPLLEKNVVSNLSGKPKLLFTIKARIEVH